MVEKVANKSKNRTKRCNKLLQKKKKNLAETLINCIRGSRSRYRTNINTDDIELSDNAMKIQECLKTFLFNFFVYFLTLHCSFRKEHATIASVEYIKNNNKTNKLSLFPRRLQYS